MTADDQQAFGELLQQHRGIVFKVAGTYARSAEDRDDLAQELAVQLWRAWPGYDPSCRFSPWMYRIALNDAISFLLSEVHRRRHSLPPADAINELAYETGPDNAPTTPLPLLPRLLPHP